jgi:hypothetical protein
MRPHNRNRKRVMIMSTLAEAAEDRKHLGALAAKGSMRSTVLHDR